MTEPRRAALLTGERGAGKTELCGKLSALAARVGGLLSLPLADARGRRIGILAHCIETGEEWELARTDVERDGPRTGRYSFSREGIERAVRVIRGALLLKDGIAVIDEIGPLELEQGAGFFPVLDLLAVSGDLLIVVRPGLVPRLAALLPAHRREVFTLTTGNRDGLLPAVAGFFGLSVGL